MVSLLNNPPPLGGVRKPPADLGGASSAEWDESRLEEQECDRGGKDGCGAALGG